MFSRAVEILAIVAAAFVVALLTLASRGAEPTTQPATRPAVEDVDIVLLSKAAAPSIPYAYPAVCRWHSGCVLVVVSCESDWQDEDCDPWLNPDVGGPCSEAYLRRVVEFTFPGRECVLMLVVPPVPEGPDPGRM